MAGYGQRVADDTTPTILGRLCWRLFQRVKLVRDASHNVEDMADGLSQLRASRNDLREAISKSPQQTCPEQVDSWFVRVEKVEARVAQIQQDHSNRCLCTGSLSPNIFSRYAISRRAVEKRGEIRDLLREYNDTLKNPKGDQCPTASCIANPSPAAVVVGKTSDLSNGVGEKPLRRFTGAFHAISQNMGPNHPPLTTEAFADACFAMNALIRLMGDNASFWLDEYAPKVEQIKRASRHATTLEELIQQDRAGNSFKAAESNSRTLFRLNRALEVVKVLFEQLLKGREVTFQSAGTTAYMVVFARDHVKLVQNIVIAATSSLPDRAWILNNINENEDDAIIEMRKYVDACAVVNDYINELFKHFNPW